MPVSRTRKAIVTGAASLGVLLGAAGITAAVTNPGGATDSATEADHEQPPAYQSSITAPDGAAVDGLAKITAADALAAAQTATGGTAGKVELENESGNVVFGVDITQPDGTKLDVKVDAGTGQVLAKESDGDRGAEHGRETNDDGNESSERSGHGEEAGDAD
jgi:uncharacterized membrane protein YkoI